MIATYMAELQRAVRTRGRARRRFLAECRDHLADLATATDETQAVGTFGEPTVIAAAFDLECAARRGVRGASATVAGVIATGGSTLALIHAAQPGVDAPPVWAITFFLAAQVAVVCVALLVVHALRIRRSAPQAADIALLCRRAVFAIGASAVTMFAAGAALPGRGSAALLLGGPLLACVAFVVVLRARTTTRRLAGSAEAFNRSPFADLRALTGMPVPPLGPAAVAVLAALCAFGRDLGESGSTVLGSIGVAFIEAALVIGAYWMLRRPLGLRATAVD